MTPSTAPAVFFGHGSPTTILTENTATKTWREIGDRFEKPKAIICVSAHWFTRGSFVTAMDRPRTIHDFGPLSPELFKMSYPAPGAPDLAAQVRDALSEADVGLDHKWGLDHGAWTVLSKAYPDADVPVVQLSVDGTKPPEWHLKIAQKLSAFRDDGVLIAGSGNIVHNLSVMEWKEGVPPYDWAVRFHDYIVGNVEARNYDAVASYRSAGEDAALAVPHPDHFLPILYVLGASRDDDRLTVESDYYEFKSLSMASFVFAPE